MPSPTLKLEILDKTGAVRADGYPALADDADLPQAGPVAVSLSRFLDEPALHQRPDPFAVSLEPGDDPRRLIPFFGQIAAIRISFKTFRDGRGFSQARMLREAGFSGEIWALGDVLRDQLAYMVRTGFDVFAITDADPAAALAAALKPRTVFQAAADGQVQASWRRYGRG